MAGRGNADMHGGGRLGQDAHHHEFGGAEDEAPEASARMLLFMGIPYFGLSAEPALGWCQASV